MPDLFDRIREALEVHPAVTSVALAGSRARGDATSYSDWDVKVVTSDLDSLASALPSLVAPLDPIATLWDRLAPERCFMSILPGPVKVDIIIDIPHEPEPAYDVDATTLQHIDNHFWDWSLWLTSKLAKRKHDLVASELEKMHGYILEPMGVERVPHDLGEAVDVYEIARDHHEARFGVTLDRRLASEIAPVVRRVLEPRMRPLAYERSKLFDQEADRYDRYRPTYPDALIDELLGPEPASLAVLDVGCGTGIASKQMAERGANVLGVEVAPRMAEIARSHGIDVEVSAFEDWDDAGRTFDRVTSAQAWHWLDLPLATTKAASLLRPGGRLCLFWNAGWQPDDLADSLEEVYASVVPPDGHRVFRGYAADRSTDARTGLDAEVDAVAAVPDLGAPTMKWFPWTRAYHRDEWLDQLLSRSDHTALKREVLDRLLEGVGAAIDDRGGSFVMSFETVLITATRLG